MFKPLLIGSGILLSASVTQAYSNCVNSPMRSLTRNSMVAIASNICSLDAIRENERLPLTIKTTSTYFHEFEVTQSEDIITAEGSCSMAVDFTGKTIKEGIPFKIAISAEDWRNKRNPVFKGTMGKDTHIGRMTLALKFNDSSYLNENCGGSSYSDRTLSEIVLGDGVLDILRRERSNISAIAKEQEWDGIPSNKAIRLDFQVGQFTGRKLSIITSYDSYRNILVKTGNYLFRAEGAREFDYDFPKANNVFVRDLGKFKGCSKFEQDGELDIPYMTFHLGCSMMQLRANKFSRIER